MERIAKIKLNEPTPFLHWDYVVDVYEGERLVSRAYTDSVLIASEVAAAQVKSTKQVLVEV